MKLQKIKSKRLFVIIQPLQYLQALEIIDDSSENILIALWAHQESQLHDLVQPKTWDRIIWLDFSGSVIDILKNCRRIKNIIGSIGRVNEVIVSAYYNEFMNLIGNGEMTLYKNFQK